MRTERDIRLAFPKPKKENKRKTRWRKGLDGKRHEFLYGATEHLIRRIEIYKQAGGDGFLIDGDFMDKTSAMCRLCGPPHPILWDEGHWIHLEKRHCDCVSCGTFGCKAAHTRLHHGGREFL